jgi:hypothetical protein
MSGKSGYAATGPGTPPAARCDANELRALASISSVRTFVGRDVCTIYLFFSGWA